MTDPHSRTSTGSIRRVCPGRWTIVILNRSDVVLWARAASDMEGSMVPTSQLLKPPGHVSETRRERPVFQSSDFTYLFLQRGGSEVLIPYASNSIDLVSSAQVPWSE